MSGLSASERRELADKVLQETEDRLIKMATRTPFRCSLPWLVNTAKSRAADGARYPSKKNGLWHKSDPATYSTADAEIICFRLTPMHREDAPQIRVLFLNDLLSATKGEAFVPPTSENDPRVYMELTEIQKLPFLDREDVYYPIDKEEAKIEWQTYLKGSFQHVPNRVSWVYPELLLEHLSRLFFELATAHYYIAPVSGSAVLDGATPPTIGKFRLMAVLSNARALRLTYDRAVGNAVLGRTTEYLAANGISIRKPQ